MRNIIFAVILVILPLIVFAQDAGKKKAYYFYGEQCPHCKKVDEYFQANGIYDKYDITKLEFSNPFNARLLVKFGEVHKSEYKGSVPAIAFGDKFIVGDQPITDNFTREIGVAENAYELPDPEKVARNPENTNQSAENNPASAGNKENYFPVLLVALVIIGGGVLVYINKKSRE